MVFYNHEEAEQEMEGEFKTTEESKSRYLLRVNDSHASLQMVHRGCQVACPDSVAKGLKSFSGCQCHVNVVALRIRSCLLSTHPLYK